MVRPTHLLSESNDALMGDASLDLAMREQNVHTGTAPQKRNALRLVHRLLRGRYVWLTIFAVLLGGAGGAVGWKKGAKTFASEGKIKVNYELPVVYGVTPETYLQDADSYFQEQISNLSSWRVLSKAVQHPEWAALHRLPADITKNPGEMTLYVQDLASHVKVSQKNNQIIVEGRDRDPTIAMAAARSVTESFRGAIYIDHEDDLNYNKVAELLKKDETKIKSDIEAIRKSIEPIAVQYGSEKLDAQYSNQLALVSQDETKIQLLTATLALSKKPDPGQDPATQPATTLELTEPALAVVDVDLAGLDEKINQMTLSLAEAKRGTSAIKVKDLQEAIEATERARDARYAHVLLARASGIALPNVPQVNDEHALKEAQANLDYLIADSNKLKTQLLKIGQDNRDLQDLRTQEEEARQKLKTVTDRLEQVNREDPAQNRMTIVTSGDQPVMADKDTRPKFAAVGGGGGLLGATALVMLMGYLSGKVKSPRDLAFDLDDEPLLGLIPQLQKGQDASKLAAMAAEYVHRSRNMLEIWARGNQRMVIGVTSPSHGSGNTSVAMSLGVSFATAGIKTLLIDVDFVTNGLTPRLKTFVRRELGRLMVRLGMISEEKLDHARRMLAGETGGTVNGTLAVTANNGQNGYNGNGINGVNGSNGASAGNGAYPKANPQRDRALGETCLKLGYITQEQLDRALAIQSREPVGLLDALNGEPLDNCVGKTGIHNLSILPRGNVTPGHAAKLSSHSMRQVLAVARQQYDTIIIDTSAISTSLEAAIVASSVDGMVMTVARGEKRTRMMDAIKRLNVMGCPVAGVIFNHVLPKDMPPETNIGRISTMNINPDDEETIQANMELVTRLAMLGPLASSMVSRVPVLDEQRALDDE